jgi:hypothetical protein
MFKTDKNRSFLIGVITGILLFGCNQSDTEWDEKLHHWEPPQHPYLAPNGRSNVHNDAYMTDVYTGNGPEGDHLYLNFFEIARVFITIAFDNQGRVLSLGTGADSKRAAYLLTPDSLKLIDSYELPGGTDLSASGAGYFYIDEQERMVLPTTNKHIYRLKVEGNPPKFQLEKDYDLCIIPDPCHIVSALPDWNGNLWFVTEEGIVGIANPNGAHKILQLKHNEGTSEVKETIKNSFAADETGAVYVVSDYALYALVANEQQVPEIVWREEYDRGNRIKPGQFHQGSGTTPTLISDGYITITDNAEPRMQVLVYKRKRTIEGDRLVCKVPVFSENASATENSLIAFGNSILVENNYGYTKASDFTGKFTEPGLARIGFESNGNCSGCYTNWNVKEVIPSVVSKVALGNNTVYTYTKEPDGWYFTGLDLETGQKKFQTRAGGDEVRYNNHYSGIAIGPDGSAYIGCAGGIIRFSEKGPSLTSSPHLEH